MKDKIKNIFIILIGYTIYCCLLQFLSYIDNMLGFNITWITIIAVIIFSILCIKFMKKKGLKVFGSGIKDYKYLALIIIPIILCGISSFGKIDLQPSFFVIITTFVQILLLALGEEFWFRGVGTALFNNKENKKTCIIIISIIFGLSHLSNIFYGQELLYTIGQAIFCICSGAFWLMLYEKTNNIVISIIAHTAHNIAVDTMMWNIFTTSPYYLGNTAYIALMVIVAIYYLLTSYYLYNNL
jgi:hypothetical protein